MDAYSDVPVDVLGEAKFDAAFELLPRLVNLRRADEMMPLGLGRCTRRAWCCGCWLICE